MKNTKKFILHKKEKKNQKKFFEMKNNIFLNNTNFSPEYLNPKMSDLKNINFVGKHRI